VAEFGQVASDEGRKPDDDSRKRSSRLHCKVQSGIVRTAPSGIIWGVMSLIEMRNKKHRGSDQPSLHLALHNEPSVEWSDYPRIVPGDYPAYCKRAHWYWDPGFKRWTCILLFDVFSEGLQSSPETIPMWFNGGTGDKPKAGRRTLYFSEWVRANGGPPPRNDRLPPKVFVGRMAKVKVADTTKGALPYSVIRQIIEWSTGQAVNQSHSQGRHEWIGV
jgi:hypothetical protein